VDQGVERIALSSLYVSSTHIIAYAFNPEAYGFRFTFSTSSQVVSEWQRAFPESVAAFNGAFFHDDQFPSGTLITQGQSVGTRSFDTDKSGLLDLAPIMRITDGVDQDLSITPGREAAQSFPMLIRDHQPSVLTESGKTARRTFVAERDDGAIVLGVVTDGVLTLYQLAIELARQELRLRTALNLDGGPSSGMSVQLPAWHEVSDSLVPIPIAIVVIPKHQP
jgi:uncharacterized protein YigE (DUF2233 family)